MYSLIQTRSRSSSRRPTPNADDPASTDHGLTEQCCICNQRIALNLRQHILQSHKGCGARLLDRTESCGEMFDQTFWLCNQCLSDHEINYSNFCITWDGTSECSVIVRSARRLRSHHERTLDFTHLQFFINWGILQIMCLFLYFS